MRPSCHPAPVGARLILHRLTRARAALSIASDAGRVRMTLTRDRRTELLAACPLFRGIQADDLATLAERATQVDFPPNHVIARQGDVGTGFFVIVSGQVRIVRDGDVLTRLGGGEFFGELSVLDRMPRTASVIAETPTTCLALASWDFDAILLQEPALTLAILRGVARRLRDVTEMTRH
jgi:CRP-like cAMP-binding protein